MSGTTHLPALSRLTSNIGAEITGLHLGDEIAGDARLDGATVDLLRAAVAEHHMVVLRDQHLTAAQHAVVARAFGPIHPSPVQLATCGPGVEGAVSTIEDTASRPPAGFPWHSDLSWLRDTPALGFLAAVVIPPYGGDTIWASTAAMYDALPPRLQELCERSTAFHAPDESLLASVAAHHGPEVAARLRALQPGAEHPLVRRHPRTGRKHLFLSPLYASRIVGPAGADGSLLAQLHAMLDDPHVQVRWRWRDGDFVIWDEASTCHRALTDHFPQHRVMRRCVTSAVPAGGTRGI